MPPSPAMGFSPRRTPKGDDNHKRGRSPEGGTFFREKDDDLALFKEIQTRDTDNFLLQSNDDFDDMFTSKLRYESEYKPGISVPVRGDSTDLLNADVEKTDYDWLLTPPETPLFSSLDDELPPNNLAQRGRPRSNPMSISRSSTMEKSYGTSRGSASPQRLSPSPRSGNITCQPRGRPSAEPHSSPTPTLRQATPSRKPSPPPSKTSTHALRSSTSTPGRMSPGSSSTVTSSRVRGTSPVKTTRGNTISPKVIAWQSNIPGFSLEAPPNLRTSLADRPASYVRGSSPASRNGRQSLSPTASRSASSSHSHDRDRFSSRSKGSVASSGDDDLDYLQSIPTSRSQPSTSRKVGAFPNSRALGFSKKPSRTVHSSSAPKRYSDLALRQMDQRKGPKNMFRPLLSSVPSSTFYVGKTSAAHHAMISRNSSVTTSSNASSDQGTCGAHDAEGSDLNQDNMATEYGKEPYLIGQDEVFVLDQADAVNISNTHVVTDGSPSMWHGDLNRASIATSQLGDSKIFSCRDTDMQSSSMSESVGVKSELCKALSLGDIALCSLCGHQYCVIKSIEDDLKLCPDCRRANIPLSITPLVTSIIVPEISPSLSVNISEEHTLFDALVPLVELPESHDLTNTAENRVIEHEHVVKAGETSQIESRNNFLSENSLLSSLLEKSEQSLANQKVIGQSTLGFTYADTGGQQTQCFGEHSNLKADVSQGTGISILLNKSSSGNGPVVRGITLSATCIAYDDLSYVTGNSGNNTRSSGGRSASPSSSVDLGSARQTETRVQRQLSGKNSNMENYRHDTKEKHQFAGSSLSVTPGHEFQTSGLSTSTHEVPSGFSVNNVENDTLNSILATSQDLLALENNIVNNAATGVECDNVTEIITVSTSMSHNLNDKLGNCSSASYSNSEDSISIVSDENVPNNARSVLDVEFSDVPPDSSTLEENTMINSSVDGPPTLPLLDAIMKMGIQNDQSGSSDSQSVVSVHSNCSIDELQESSAVISSDKDKEDIVAESDPSDHPFGILDYSTIPVGGNGKINARNITLEEATDTILLCSSIVHDLAYEAATIAIDKEKIVPLEGSQPAVTILGKFTSDEKEPRSRIIAGRRAFKSQRSRQRQLVTGTEPCYGRAESDEKTDVSPTHIVGLPNKDSGDNTKPPNKLESKCNCTIM